MRINKKTFAFWVCAFLPLIAVLACFPTLPNTIPAHWGFSGNVDRFGSKYELFTAPVITILFAAMLQLSVRYTRHKAESGKIGNVPLANVASVNSVGFICNIIFLFLTAVQLYASYTFASATPSISPSRMIAIVTSISFILIGNVLPKCKRNSMIGIRVSWTLDNDEVWYHTHRFGGKVFIIGGLISTIACIFAPESAGIPIMLITLLILTVIVCIYAHHIFYKLKAKKI